MTEDFLIGTADDVAQALGMDLSAVTIVLGLAESMKTISERGGWDQPPFLATLDRIGVAVDTEEGSAITAIGATVLELPMWAFSSGAVTAETFGMLADLLAEHESEYAADCAARDVFGFLYVIESWRLTDDAARAFQAQDEIRSMKDWPGRREVRVGMVVDRAGYRYDVTHFRDTGEIKVSVDKKGNKLGGRIIDGLAKMAAALPMPTDTTPVTET